LNSNQLIVLSTKIHDKGHLILVKGYKGPKIIYANDPFGDGNLVLAQYGKKMNGANVAYDYKWEDPQWMVFVGEE
jgi:hypothetical protein